MNIRVAFAFELKIKGVEAQSLYYYKLLQYVYIVKILGFFNLQIFKITEAFLLFLAPAGGGPGGCLTLQEKLSNPGEHSLPLT